MPGAQGPAGSDGNNGTDGVNAYTSLTSSFTVPAVDANVVIQVSDSSWMATGQILFIQNAGYYEFQSASASTNATVKNLGYAGNEAEGETVASANKVSPGGVKGTDGTNGVDGDEPNVPLTSKGDLFTRNATDNDRLGVGANGTRLVADSGEATGLKWAKVDLTSSNEVTGALPIANGGTGQITATLGFNALSPVTTRGDIIVRGATNNQRLAVGSANTLLRSDGTDPNYGQVTQDYIAAGGPMSRYGLLGRLIGADFNVTTDQQISILSGVSRYIIRRIITDNASINLTTAAGGIYTLAGKAGVTIVAAGQVYSALTASTKWKDLTLEAVVGTDVFTQATLFFSLTTAQGAAATGNIWLFGENLTP